MTVALGRYQVGDVVGSGRTGRVMRGERADDGADVAVRQIPPRLLEDPEVRKVLKNLPFRCFGLRSSSIVPVLDAFEISGSIAVVEPWIDGAPLSRGRDAAGNELTREVAGAHLAELLEGLLELHDRGAAHGDVRADNILLTAQGPRLVGLGVADGLKRRLKAAQGMGATGSTEIGDAPELADSDPTVATDLFGLAAAYRVVLRNAGVPASDPLMKAVEKGAVLDPAGRFGGAEDFLEAVRPELEALRAAEAVAEHGGTPRRRRKTRSALDETGIDVGSGLSFDDLELSQADISVDASEGPPSAPPPRISSTNPFGAPAASPPEPPPAPAPPGPVGGPPKPQPLNLGFADDSVQADDGLAVSEDGPELAEKALPDDVTTAGRYRAVPLDDPRSRFADYKWLIVSGGFTAVLVILYLGFLGVRALLPDLPDGMIEVPEGRVAVGAAKGPPPEVPGFEFTHSRFFLDRAEVTVAAYVQCVQAGECTPTTGRLDGSPPSGDKPVTAVTWLQAQSYCNHVGKRLPTENEWEAATRRFGGEYGTGDTPPGCEAAVFGRGDGEPCSRGVGSGPRPAPEVAETDEGVPVDLSGNVWEFVDSDWSDSRGPGTGIASPAGGTVLKVIKGGGWYSPVSQLRAAGRLPVQNIYWAADVGFRCGMDPVR